ncbi:MAG: Methyltransferase type 12 [Candidatus Parvarchaeum acidophilus ARMAN-5]|jgi:2-polyprenyl-3-methyl-5-hydroxy-6-metoxy-1,4-benzoquinol methylase|uniref:Methyltransferase type 12 n=1 Tax=Candidatus Parvarchaeum acidophilus ARMAN-5 TaxID=662762 RepID=D6GU92_PARA5|nr:MAG: Methyltransferase type 12 [Candidatus Parvarchaeum acidophilus ARMAN-5]
MDSIIYYNAIKSSYEGLYFKEQIKKIQFLLSKFEIKTPYTILDVGAGTGILETILRNNNITALEPSDMADMIVQRKLNNVSIVRETIEKFQTDKKFDFVFCITVLQDIPEEQRENAIEKMISLTNEGGFTIISVLKASGIDLSILNPMESGEIENDIYFIFRK